MRVQRLEDLPHSKEVLGSNLMVGVSFCVELVCSLRAFLGFLRVLQLPPTIQRHAG